MENKGRWGTPVDEAPCASHARQAKGTPGVLADQYAPDLTETMEISQEAYRDVMITISRLTHKKSWDIQKITKLMHLTYELQRRDIGQALQVIAEEREEEDQDDPENESEIRKLKLNWPFLFELRWQSSHFLRLCGRSSEIPMRDYYEHHLRTLFQFVTNPNTESGVKNIAEQWKWEDAGKKSELKFLLAFQMLANYFSEKQMNSSQLLREPVLGMKSKAVCALEDLL
ncbi:uncharacterized protein LOC117648330 [Thrips palmi]|uniref:Uncharacterized protein LOC117648330 n=1 Tax=Thrips palmi TaxID=161013 RepID=A0A6P8Z8P7_THRPL|nr:uncharacterized protein LOC117648330 [Thrips palmi]